MRTFEEIDSEVTHAANTNDASSLITLSFELEGLQTTNAAALAANARGIGERLRGNYEQALELCSRALQLFEELGDRSGVAAAINNIGNIYYCTGEYASALNYLQRGVVLREELGDRAITAGIFSNIGNVHLALSESALALENYKRALGLYEEQHDKSGIARVTANIGAVYNDVGDYAAALDHYHRGLDLFKEFSGDFYVATLNSNIGVVHFETGDYTSALEYYEIALALHEKYSDISGAALVIGNIGSVYVNIHDYNAALDYYRRALAMREALGERNGIALVTGNIIRALTNAGSVVEAQELLEKTDTLQIDVPATRVTREMCRANLQERRGEYEEAKATLHKALAITRERNMRMLEANVQGNLRELAKKRNDLAEYIEHNDEYARITAEINGKETATKVAMQEAERRIAKERQEHEKHLAVLHSTLPKHIADRVARGETVNDHFENAAVMFLDIVGFTTLSSTLTSQQVTTLLDAVFEICDEACKQYNVTRIKTIGDSYLAVGGLEEQKTRELEEQKTRVVAEQIASAALEIIEQIQIADFASLLVASSRFQSLQVRIGLHCGPVTAGVLGKDRLQYDIWGDTVNIASRMESSGEPGRIQVSEQFANALSPLSAKERGLGESSRETLKERGLGESSQENNGEGTGESSLKLALRGEIEIKGKGMMQTYWLERAK